MIDHLTLLTLADLFTGATGVRDVTLSHRLFGDSKKLAALRDGADITVGRFNSAVRWFSTNWPEDLAWPHSVPRPEPLIEAAE